MCRAAQPFDLAHPVLCVDRMDEPSRESLGIERSLLELYEPNEHAKTMMAIDFLHDLAHRSVTMQDALSTDLLMRQRITSKLRLHMTAAFGRVACTYTGVRIVEDGHGTWKVLGLQPRAKTNIYTAASSSSSAYSEGLSQSSTGEHLPSRSNSSRPKRARLPKAEAELLQPTSTFRWMGETYEIVSRDHMQSTAAKQYYHLKQGGKVLHSSYERNSQWVVLEQPTSPTEESWLGCVSSVLDGKTINSWDDEKVCRQRN